MWKAYLSVSELLVIALHSVVLNNRSLLQVETCCFTRVACSRSALRLQPLNRRLLWTRRTNMYTNDRDILLSCGTFIALMTRTVLRPVQGRDLSVELCIASQPYHHRWEVALGAQLKLQPHTGYFGIGQCVAIPTSCLQDWGGKALDSSTLFYCT